MRFLFCVTDEKQVSIQDVLSVVNNVYGTASNLTGPSSSENGESFPLHQKLLICTMILIKKNSKSKEINIGRVSYRLFNDIH